MIFKTGSPVNGIFIDKTSSLYFMNEKCILVSENRKINYDLKFKALGGINKLDNIIFYTEKGVFSLNKESKEVIKICDKESLDCVIFLSDEFLIVSDKEIVTYDLTNLKNKIENNKNIVKNRGVCVGGKCIYKNDKENLYLAFEDGSICTLEKEILKMDENITSFDISHTQICIAFFYKKISICNIDNTNFKYTEIPFTPKIIRFWKGHLIILDEENNFFLMDTDLKILYIENYEDKLSHFEVIEDILYLVMKDGRVISMTSITEYI